MNAFLQRICGSALPAVAAAALVGTGTPDTWSTASTAWSFPPQRFTRRHPSGVLCEPLHSQAQEKYDDDDDEDDPLNPDPSLYERMDLPHRAHSDTHVIYSALLADNLVEEYHAYRNRHDQSVTAVVKLGHGVDGHPGVVHGGILALLMDDVLGFGYEALGDVPLAVTANLNINYLQSVPAGARIFVKAQLQQREGRKLYWKVRVVSSSAATENEEEEDPSTVVYCEATSLFIIPRHVYQEESSSTNETTARK